MVFSDAYFKELEEFVRRCGAQRLLDYILRLEKFLSADDINDFPLSDECIYMLDALKEECVRRFFRSVDVQIPSNEELPDYLR